MLEPIEESCSGTINYSMASKNLVKDMLILNEEKRPSAFEILHKYSNLF
jgi:hypothetical protein